MSPYRHVGKVLLMDPHQVFGEAGAAHILNELRHGEAVDRQWRSLDRDSALKTRRAVHGIRRLPGVIGHVDPVVSEPLKRAAGVCPAHRS